MIVRSKGRRWKLLIRNTSQWPTLFIRAIAVWLMKQADTRANVAKIELIVKNTKRVRHGHCEYWSGRIVAHCARRMDKRYLLDNYKRYAWSAQHELASPVEMLIKLLAHEIRHLAPENTSISVQGSEHDAEHWAWERVLEYRATFKKELFATMREQHRAERLADKAKQDKIAFKNSREFKLAEAEKMLKKWETRQKRDETFVKKYKRKIRALYAAETREQRMAAKGNSNGGHGSQGSLPVGEPR